MNPGESKDEARMNILFDIALFVFGSLFLYQPCFHPKKAKAIGFHKVIVKLEFGGFAELTIDN